MIKIGLFKILKAISDADKERNEKDIDKYNLTKEEKEQVRKGNYEPDEFDRDDDKDSDEDY